MLKEKAIVYGVLGDLDMAFETLARSYELDPASALETVTDPTMAPAMMEDPRMDRYRRLAGLD